MMPKKDGFSLAQDIRKMDKSIPIIFLTAKSKENIIKAFKLGADDYLTKPFSIDELCLELMQFLKESLLKRNQNLKIILNLEPLFFLIIRIFLSMKKVILSS